MRRIAALVVAATALAVIPMQASQAAKSPECLSRKAQVFKQSNQTFSFGFDDVVVIKGNNNIVEVDAPGPGQTGDESFVCVLGKHNRLRGTYYRAYSQPGYDNFITHGDPCDPQPKARFYNFAQVDLDSCQ